MKVYLTGPITGSADPNICGWRDVVRDRLAPFVEVIDPAAAPYDSIPAYRRTEKSAAAIKRLMHGRFVVDRNRNLIRSCDIVLANFLTAEQASIGSVGELFWADAFGKLIVIIREKAGNVHDHAMLNAIASATVSTIDDGCKAVLNILGTQAELGKTG
jgi:nucleoside 2-deoxyribosyltransferase